MEMEELFGALCRYATHVLSYEEYHSMGIEGFRQYVREHYVPIPKSELIAGEEYRGMGDRSMSARWDGNAFQIYTHKGNDTASHYEDGGKEVFVPIKEI